MSPRPSLPPWASINDVHIDEGERRIFGPPARSGAGPVLPTAVAGI